ncbi:MAG: hypothetical protein M3Z20_08855 [Chloroflexota bacterium]|nr:hypothetical protein [Chloroflexota bacterium]
MDFNHFAALAQTIVPSRQSTLATLVAPASRFSGRARARGKKKGSDCGKRAQQRCSNDVETCRAMYMSRCKDAPEYCLTIAACCDTCSADGMLTCLLKLQETTTAARLALRENGDRDA